MPIAVSDIALAAVVSGVRGLFVAHDWSNRHYLHRLHERSSC